MTLHEQIIATLREETRKRRGSLPNLAHEAGLSYSFVQKVHAGALDNLTLRNVDRLSDALGIAWQAEAHLVETKDA